MKRLISCSLVLFVLAPGVAAAEELPPPPATCIDNITKVTTRYAFEITIALERRHVPWQTQFENLHAAIAKVRAYASGRDAVACGERFPRHGAGYAAWLDERVEPVIAEARDRINEICSVFTREHIRRSTQRIRGHIARGRLAAAADEADALEASLGDDSMYAGCEPAAAARHEVLAVVLPSVRAEIAVPNVRAGMAAAYEEAHEAWRATEAALATSGRARAPLPASTRTEAARAAVAAAIERCLEAGRHLDDLGGDPAAELVAGASVADGRAFCERAAGGRDAVFSRAIAHQQAYEEAERKRWEHLNIKGWGMQVVYDERGRPDEVRTGAGAIVWVYCEGAVCQEIRFSSRGAALAAAR